MAPQPTTYFHSVELQRNKCQGCVSCVKLCPTEAIRVRNGKAEILGDRCIDCGACAAGCPYHAFNVKTTRWRAWQIMLIILCCLRLHCMRSSRIIFRWKASAGPA